jgi:hypothetical protein
MYIKALEQEVLRLKEVFTSAVRERDAMAEENRKLKELLAQHGIPFDPSSPGTVFGRTAGSSYGGSTAGSVSGYNPGTASTGYTSPPSIPNHAPPPVPKSGAVQQQQQASPANGLDYDQIGIDFVLTYDRTPYLSPPPQ